LRAPFDPFHQKPVKTSLNLMAECLEKDNEKNSFFFRIIQIKKIMPEKKNFSRFPHKNAKMSDILLVL
jgi:hypothetical protein